MAAPHQGATSDLPRVTHLGEHFTSYRPPNPSSIYHPPVQLNALDHLALPAHNLDTMLVFYTTVLGFVRMMERPAFPFDGVWLQGPGVVLHLIEVDTTAPEPARQVCFRAYPPSHHIVLQRLPADLEPWHMRRSKHFGMWCGWALAARNKQRYAQHFLWTTWTWRSKHYGRTALHMTALRSLEMHHCHQRCFCWIQRGACRCVATPAFTPPYRNGIELRQ